MSEEIIEHAMESSNEVVSELHAHGKSQLTKQVSLTTLVLAMITAMAGLLAGITANESLFMRTGEIIDLSRQETDKIIAEVLKTRAEMYRIVGSAKGSSEQASIQALLEEVESLSKMRVEEEAEILNAVLLHEIFAFSVTILSLAITLGGVALIVERRQFWYISLVFGFIGAAIFVVGMIRYF